MAVRKIINSDKQYTPVVMDKVILDTVPTVGSFNSVTSDAVARAITEAGNVPTPEASDAGKVLGVLNSSGDIGWVEDQSGTLTQVQSDWAQTDNTQVNYIQHKPDLSVYAEASDVETALASKQDVISDLATIRSGAAAGASAVQPASLATVATTGAYSDLSGKPDLSGFATTQAMNTALAGKQDTIEDLSSIRTGAGLGATAVQPSSLAAVATTGDYDDLTNKPTIPAAQVQADWNESDTSSKAFILNKPVIPAGVVVDQTYDASSANAQSGTAVASAISTKQDIISDLATIRSGAADGATAVQPGNLATVATTGAYSDLSGTPTIPVVDQSYSSSSVNAQSGVAVAGAIANKQDTIADLATIRANALLGSTAVQPGDLATVATTGAYSDLSGTPTIPSGDELVPSASSIDAGKVLTVDNNGDPAWVTPSAGTVYTAGDGVDITNNVISADVDGTTIGIDSSTKKIKLLSTIPTVDQTYNAASANAQSGVAVASAISTKQDTISDLATIRSGAAAGATAVQPSSLATVATSGSYNDLSDKPSIPAAQVNSDWNSSSGVTQILNKPTLATVATTGDYEDLLNKPSIPAAVTVDQTYNASSTNAQSGTAVAEAVAAISVDEVPAVTSSDNNKVLKATYSGGTGSYAWANETGTTYTASDGIQIDQYNRIKARIGKNLGFSAIPVANNMSSPVFDYYGQNVFTFIGQVNSTIVAKLKNATFDITITKGFSVNMTDATAGAHFALVKKGSNNQPNFSAQYIIADEVLSTSTSSFSVSQGAQFTVDFSALSADSTASWIDIFGIEDQYYLTVIAYSSTQPISSLVKYITGVATYGVTSQDVAVYYTPGADKEIYAIDQVPASTSADSTKVLTVDSSGAPVWAAAQGGTVDQVYNASSTNAQSGTAVAGALAAVPTKPLVAGSNITITENTNNITLAATMPTVDEVPAVTSSDDGKVLKASYSGGTGSYAWSAEPTVDEVPAVTSSDDGKVLKATYSGGTGSYAWAAAPTVDQTYNSSSTNAQSGVAVASAISTAIGPIETALSNL